MINLALKRIQAMQSYQPPLDGRAAYAGVLLDFNERTTDQAGRQRYPEYGNLAEDIGRYVGVARDHILVTNGSDQALDLVFRAFADVGDKVAVPEPSFAMFTQCARVQGNRIVPFSYQRYVKLRVICNPNNPTGSLTSLSAIESMAAAQPKTILLIDEAYAEFSGVSAIPLIEQYPNIIVTRTFSKAFGLAAVRIGYIVAAAQYIAELQKIRGPYDMNSAGVQAVRRALLQVDDMNAYVNEVMCVAKPLTELFFRRNGIPYLESQANFILFTPPNAKAVTATLEQHGYRLRPQHKPGIAGSIRVSIGTVLQMRGFINAYQQHVLKRPVKKLALLDRDGTLLHEPVGTEQIDNLKDVRILDDVIPALQKLVAAQYILVMVTNQDGLGTARFPQDRFDACQDYFINLLAKAGIHFEEVLICPHLQNEGCNCRKPKTALADELFSDYAIDYAQSFMCGDRATDKQFAQALGLTFYSQLSQTYVSQNR